MSDIRPIDTALARLRSVYTPGAGRASHDAEPDLAAETDDPSLPDELIWPPPGLEHIHGLTSRITGQLLFAAVVLLFPFVMGQLRDRTPDAGSWGTITVLFVDFVLLWASYMWLLVLSNRFARGIRMGYPRPLLWHVATDGARNAPRVLRGLPPFDNLTVDERVALLDARVTATAFTLAGVLWVTLVFPFAVTYAAAGRIASGSVWWITLLPAALCLGAGVFFRIREVRATYLKRVPDDDDRHAAQQVLGWRDMYERAGYAVTRGHGVLRYRLAAAAAFFAVFLISMPLTIAAFTTVIPQIVQTNPQFYSATTRMAALEPLRAYRLPMDSTISAQRAGEAYHSLIMAGSAPVPPGLKTPIRTYANALTANEEFRVLARATALDMSGTRWNMGRAGDVPPWRMAPGAHRLRLAATMHIDLAKQQLERGRADSAEMTLREVLSTGFLVADEAINVWDLVTALSAVQMGAQGLADHYERTGRNADAASLRGTISATAAVHDITQAMSAGTRTPMRSAQIAVFNKRVPRAIRWDLFTSVSTTARCGTVASVVFGPGERYTRFREMARKELVRYPADTEYFELASLGYTETIRARKGSCDYRWLRDAITGYRH